MIFKGKAQEQFIKYLLYALEPGQVVTGDYVQKSALEFLDVCPSISVGSWLPDALMLEDTVRPRRRTILKLPPELEDCPVGEGRGHYMDRETWTGRDCEACNGAG